MIEWWILIGIAVLLVVGGVVAGRASSRHEPVGTEDLRYVRFEDEIYFNSTDLAAALRLAGHDEVADRTLRAAHAAAAELINSQKQTGL